MSWYDEDGNYPHRVKTNAEDDVCCEGCDENIKNCTDGKLWYWNNSYYCKECIQEIIFDDLTAINADDPTIND